MTTRGSCGVARRSLLEPDTHQFDLGLEDRSILASLDDLRFRRVDIGEHTGDPGLLERNMSVDGGKGINQLGVLCTQGIEFCGRFGGVGAARFALGPKVSDVVLRNRSTEPEPDSKRQD